MGLWNEKLNTSKERTTARKEIDWEERHFQICLALLSRTETRLSGVTIDPQMPLIIERADKMVELLKDHYEEMLYKEAKLRLKKQHDHDTES